MSEAKTKTAVVTGASSGIGAATAQQLAAAGFHVFLAARRAERINALAAQLNAEQPGSATAVVTDVTDEASVAALAATVGESLDVLINNAGGAHGSAPIKHANTDDWRWMYEVNVIGTMQVTRALLPALLESGAGTIVNVSSIAGMVTYMGGAGYTTAKHAERVISETLRNELLGKPIRVMDIAPGMVHTEEFSLVRFAGDQAKADAVYDGVPDPLVADDIADAITFMVTRPQNVNIDQLVIRPRAQAPDGRVYRP